MSFNTTRHGPRDTLVAVGCPCLIMEEPITGMSFSIGMLLSGANSFDTWTEGAWYWEWRWCSPDFLEPCFPLTFTQPPFPNCLGAPEGGELVGPGTFDAMPELECSAPATVNLRATWLLLCLKEWSCPWSWLRLSSSTNIARYKQKQHTSSALAFVSFPVLLHRAWFPSLLAQVPYGCTKSKKTG